MASNKKPGMVISITYPVVVWKAGFIEIESREDTQYEEKRASTVSPPRIQRCSEIRLPM
jgi:hypothetical protein